MFAPVINLVLIFILTQLPLFVVRKTQKFLHSAFLCYNNLISCLMFMLGAAFIPATSLSVRSEEHTSELQSPDHLVCGLLLEKKKNDHNQRAPPRFHLDPPTTSCAAADC